MSENAYQVFDWTEFAVLHPLHILFLFLWGEGAGDLVRVYAVCKKDLLKQNNNKLSYVFRVAAITKMWTCLHQIYTDIPLYILDVA